ncbi:MAG: hypothetical protein IKZ99_08860 [Salinivirgaceae bacterium]|nr:hypothetical protein [Salinivirgaceae bacterium]
MNKTNVQNQLPNDYFNLDKCKDDKERAVLIATEIEKKQAELKQLQKLYGELIMSFLVELKQKIENQFPNLNFEFTKLGDIKAIYVLNNIHYEVNIFKGKVASKLECGVRVGISDVKRKKQMEKAVMSKFKDVLEYTDGRYTMYKTFSTKDFDSAISCYYTLIEGFEELTNSQQ